MLYVIRSYINDYWVMEARYIYLLCLENQQGKSVFWLPHQSYHTALAQHPPPGREISATTSADAPSSHVFNCQICTKPFSVSVKATNSSLKGAGATAFAAPPDVVVSVRNSCSSIDPVVGDMENALM